MNERDAGSSELQQSLTKLHATLSSSPAVDAGSRQSLRDVLGDIERLLKTPATPSVPAASRAPEAPPEADSPSSRLEALTARFDAGHPTLSASLREFIDLLGRAGL
jgi:Domain of unknown function (DUF4404)